MIQQDIYILGNIFPQDQNFPIRMEKSILKAWFSRSINILCEVTNVQCTFKEILDISKQLAS